MQELVFLITTNGDVQSAIKSTLDERVPEVSNDSNTGRMTCYSPVDFHIMSLYDKPKILWPFYVY